VDAITIGILNGRGRLRVTIGPPMTFDLSEFNLEAVPFGLAHLNRFGGQAGVYSDAQHSVLLSRIVGSDPALKAAALLHDCGEPLGAGDTNTFLKRELGASRLSDYEDALCGAIWDWCGLEVKWGIKYHVAHSAIHHLDKAIGTEEARQLGFPVPVGSPELPDTLKRFVDTRVRWFPRAAIAAWNEAWREVTRED
jgi:hypothetical protein